MDETKLILDTVKQTFDGRAWHGPSLMTVLKGVDKAQASRRPIGARHTIWEIVDHCSCWMEVVTRTLADGRIPDVKPDEDWLEMGATDEDWTRTLKRIKKAYKNLTNSVKTLNEAQISQEVRGSFNDKPYTTTYRRMLHGVSDHNTYHAGQIAILRERKAE